MGISRFLTELGSEWYVVVLSVTHHICRAHPSRQLCIVVQVIEHWTFSLFFCMAELWGSVVISVLFWTLANDVCSVADAKIIYPIMVS